jgi:hypothetical protein
MRKKAKKKHMSAVTRSAGNPAHSSKLVINP